MSSNAGGAFRTDFDLKGSESDAAFDRLEQAGFHDRAGFSSQIVFEDQGGVDAPAVRDAMTRVFEGIESDDDESSIISPYTPEGTRQISSDGTIAYA